MFTNDELPNLPSFAIYINSLRIIKRFKLHLTLWEDTFVDSLLKRKVITKESGIGLISVSEKEFDIVTKIEKKIFRVKYR